MKKLLFILICIPMIGFGQSIPQGINYQAVARDANGDVLMNQGLTIQFSVISDLATSAISWQETHSLVTNDYGLFTAIIGQGVTTNGGFSATFNDVDWGSSNHLLKLEVDYGSGFVDMGTTAFMSVPYALYGKDEDADSNNELQSLSISGDTLFISNGNYVILPSSQPHVLGCIDSLACNYNSLADIDDSSCILPDGCTDTSACNYDSTALCDDGSCDYSFGCTDSLACNYDSTAVCDDGSCDYSFGCTDSLACNYDSAALCDDSSCDYSFGCTDSLACNYDSTALCDDGSCILPDGCTDPSAPNYDSNALCDDGSCLLIGSNYQGGIIFYLDGNGGGLIASLIDQSNSAQWGCHLTDIAGASGTSVGTGAQNTIDMILANCDTVGFASQLCNDYIININGITYDDWFLPSKDELAWMHYNIGQGDGLGLGNIGGFSNDYYWSSSESYASAAWMMNFTNGVWVNNSWKSHPRSVRAIRAFGSMNNTFGCTDQTALNYDSTANIDDGSCTYDVLGCTDSLACNTDPLATVNDGSCILPDGCTDPSAPNYDSNALCDDGSCLLIGSNYQGGIIFYLDGNGGGLIAAPSDQSPPVAYTGVSWAWYDGICEDTYLGIDANIIGAGAQNTIDILSSCAPHAAAADLCANLTLGGYNDWFLPSIDELAQMYLQRNLIGGFQWYDYWSSTEASSHNAKTLRFNDGLQSAAPKVYSIPVRAIRAFGNIAIYGCTDQTAINYNSIANNDDGSCLILGCIDTSACNYDPTATIDDGSCEFISCYGCTDPIALNYDPTANIDDGSCVTIGSFYQGGIIFYLDGNGGGLIAAPTDQSSSQVTYCVANQGCVGWGYPLGCYQTNISGAEGIGIGTGSQNTIDILLGCPNPTTAANLCANLTLGGYSDWFLPSKDELNEMYLNIGQGNTLGLGNIGQFWGYLYWTSSEAGSNTAYAMNFGDGYMGHILKNYDGHVRAIRAFGGLPIYGCTDQTAINYNSIANNDDGSCLIPGCTDPTACNYDPTATIDDGSCEFISCSGCTDPIALNFNPTATIDDGSCVTIGSYYQGGIIFYLDGNGGGLIAAPFDQANSRWGCAGTLLSGVQSPAIGAGAGNTINIVSGCTTPNIAADICSDLTLGGYSDWFLPSLNELNQMYINRATINMTAIANGGGSFDELNTPWYYSSTQWNGVFARYQNFNTGIQDETNKYNIMKVRAVRAFSGASNPLPYGCMDVAGCNYDPNANTDDGSCTYPATNANCAGNCLAGFIDINGICVAFVYGCMDATACNYDPNANTDDGSCEFTTCAGCTDPTACTYDPSATIDDGSCVGLVGCTYIGSPSYDPLATCGDTTTQCLLIGDMFYGGMIFYLDGTGKGCVASMECINAACQVVCSSYSPDEFWSECGTPPQGTQIDAKFPWSTISCAPTMWLGADGAGMFDGRSNTIAILEYCDGCDGVYNANQTAARMAANAANNSSSGTKSSSCETDEWGNPNPDYARWFLPTKQQLNAMYNNIGPGNVLGLGNIGLFEETGYWSSTEESLDKAWRKSFDPSNGQNATRDKSTQYRVRAVRCFNCNIPGECD